MERDQCPKCHQSAMPKWWPGSTAEKARKCQKCGYIEEKQRPAAVLAPVKRNEPIWYRAELAKLRAPRRGVFA